MAKTAKTTAQGETPAKTKQYEMMVVLHPGLEIDLETPQKQIEKLIKARGGEINSADIWGKRKLAYPIDKSEQGIYILYRLQMPTGQLEKFNQELNITTEVLRYLVTEFDPKLEDLKKAQAERAARMDEESKSDGDDSQKPKKQEG